jgi:putative spermidine/putrescine transport system permease protein/spermidine/putrescine transport system permease protein
MRRPGLWLLGLLTLVVVLVLYAPLAVVAIGSFVPAPRGVFDWSAATVEAYRNLPETRPIVEALLRSILVSFVAVAASLVFGTVLALYHHWSRSRLRHALQLVIFLPFVLPQVVTGLALLIATTVTPVPTGLGAVIIGHIVFVTAVSYRLALMQLEALSHSLVEASLDLGASRWQTVRLVLLPNMTGALGTAALLTFVLSFDETLITLFVVGDTPTLPIRLWAMIRVGFTPEINALVTVILFASLAVTLVALRRMNLSTLDGGSRR